MGIVTRVVKDEEILVQAEALAEQMASGATEALRRAKQLIHSGVRESLETQMESESLSISDITRTQDAREGIAAFIAKRPARFEGK